MSNGRNASPRVPQAEASRVFEAFLSGLPEAVKLDAIERAAIHEYDGRLTRDEAERLTMRMWAR